MADWDRTADEQAAVGALAHDWLRAVTVIHGLSQRLIAMDGASDTESTASLLTIRENSDEVLDSITTLLGESTHR